METRKKKKIDYSEMLGAEDAIEREKTQALTSKGRKRKYEGISTTFKINKTVKTETTFGNCGSEPNWEEVVVKEETLNSDSDDLQSEDEDIEKQMEDASIGQMVYEHFMPTKVKKKKYFSEDIKLPIEIYTSKNTKVGDKCNLINYINGYLKILVNGHTYFCNRVVDNIFYWQCDQNKDCISQAVTMFNDEKHSIKSLDEHNHPPTLDGNCCLKDSRISMFLPLGIKQNSYERCQIIKYQYLIRNGYFYKKRKSEEDIDFWLCERNNSDGCKGSILTIKYENEYYVKYASEHTHINDIERQNRCINNDEELKNDGFSDNDGNDYCNEGDDSTNELNSSNYNYNNDQDEFDLELDSDQDNENKIFIKKEVESECEDIFENEDLEERTEIECDFIKSQQGNPKLCINGFIYTLNRRTRSSYWTCEFKRKKSIECRAIACTVVRDGKHIVKKMSEHNHPPRTDRKVIGQILNRIREKCIERTDLTASEVVEIELDSLSEELRKALPSKSAIYRMITRKRRLEEAFLGGSKIYERKEVKKFKNDLDIETSFEVKDTIICQTVESTRGSNKLIVEDYLFNLSRVAGDNYYWRCEQRISQKCVGFAITLCKNGVHYLKNIREHNHESQRNRKYVVQAMNLIKEMALKTNEEAIAIVENALKDISEEVLRELPTKETLIRKVNRTRYLYKPKPVGEETINKEDISNEKSHIYDIGMEIGTTCELFSPTNKGNFKLNLNGYFYHKNRINNGMHYWQCEEIKHNKCKGFAVTFCPDNSQQHILKKAKKHNHPVKGTRQDIAQIIQKIKEKAKTSNENSSLIYNDEIEHLPDDIKSLLPQRCSIISMINRIRKQNCEDDKKEPIKYDDEHEHIFEIKQLPDTECEFVESKRGFEKLTIEGYLYCREAFYNGVQAWMCIEKKMGAYNNCRGYAQTYQKGGKHFLRRAKNHNHLPNTKRLDICHLLNRMKERALTEIRTNCTQIFDEETANYSNDVLECLPLRDSVIHTLNNHRRRLYLAEKLKFESLKDENGQTNDVPAEILSLKKTRTYSSVDHIHDPFVEPGTEVEININHKGATKLNLNNFLLVRKNRRADVMYWVCQRKVSGKCRGNAITIEKNGKHFLKSTKPHNHIASDLDPPEVTEIMMKMKERARETDESVAKIFDDTVRNLPNELKNKLPPKDLAKRALKHFRLKYRPIDKGAIEPKKTNPPEVEEILKRMKDRISATMETPSKVYNDEITWVPPNVLDLMPKREKILKSLKNRKRTVKERRQKDDTGQNLIDIKPVNFCSNKSNVKDNSNEKEKNLNLKFLKETPSTRYLYVREAFYKELTVWMCMEKKNGVHRDCRGYAQTYEKDNGKHYLKQAKSHNHPPNNLRLDLCHLMNRLKERAIKERKTHCTKIFDEETAKCSTELLACLPLRDSVIYTLNRHRRKAIRAEEALQETLKTEGEGESLLTPEISLKKLKEDEKKSLNDHIHDPFVEPGTEVEINVNHKGATKLNLNGFLLVRKNKKSNSIYWACQRKVSKCRGNAITIEKDGKHYLKSTKPHNHIACDTDPPEVTEIMMKMKERARQTDESVAKIFDDTVKSLPNDIRSKLPTKDLAKRALKHFRMKYRPIDVGAIEPKVTLPPEVEQVIKRMKDRISLTMETPSTVYNDEITFVEPHVLAIMPKREKILKSLKNRKRRVKDRNNKEEFESTSLVDVKPFQNDEASIVHKEAISDDKKKEAIEKHEIFPSSSVTNL